MPLQAQAPRTALSSEFRPNPARHGIFDAETATNVTSVGLWPSGATSVMRLDLDEHK